MKTRVIRPAECITDELKALDVCYQLVHKEPWLRDNHWQPCPPNCYRIQGINLKHNALILWATNGVYHKTYLVDYKAAIAFLRRERQPGLIILDDSGIGFDQLGLN